MINFGTRESYGNFKTFFKPRSVINYIVKWIQQACFNHELLEYFAQIAIWLHDCQTFCS